MPVQLLMSITAAHEIMSKLLFMCFIQLQIDGGHFRCTCGVI